MKITILILILLMFGGGAPVQPRQDRPHLTADRKQTGGGAPVPSRQDRPHLTVQLPISLAPVAFSPDGCLMRTGGEEKTVARWSVVTGKRLHRFEWHTKNAGEAMAVAFSRDQRFMHASSGGPEPEVQRHPISPLAPLARSGVL